MKSDYKEVNSVFYHKETSAEVIEILQRCRIEKVRIVLDYGDTKTGKSWNETFGIVGKIGLSTGPLKVPILLYSKLSTSGPIINTNCIIGIRTSKGGHIIYSNKIKKIS